MKSAISVVFVHCISETVGDTLVSIVLASRPFSVFNAIIANKILYALPVYYGYLTQGHKEMLQRNFKRANRRGFTVREYDLEALAENAQYDLFHNSCSTDHCLNHIYTANRKPAGSMQLRQRGHNFALPTIHLEFNKTFRRSCIV